MDAVNLLFRLMAIRSYSGEEKNVADEVFGLLKENGFEVEKIYVGKDNYNIVAKRGKPKVVLCAHMDTVPTSIEIGHDEEKVWGRGACDTKGSMASMITAAIESVKEGMSDFGMIFTVCEETDFAGAKIIAKKLKRLPFAVIGEPTNLRIVNGHFGLLEIKIETLGKRVHSSQPEKGINAIDKLIEVLGDVKKTKLLFGSSMNIGVISGGEAVNIVPGSARAAISFRIDPKDKTDYFKTVTEICRQRAKVVKGLEMGSVLVKVPKEMDFIKQRETVKYGTELSVFKNGVVLGPGNIKYAHGDNEQVDKKQLAKAVLIYKKILRNFCQPIKEETKQIVYSR